jgi:outer membrane protein assembly factor BamB
MKWEFVTGDIVLSSPAIAGDGTIYVGSGDNKLYAINPDGTEKWEFLTGGYIRSSPAIGTDGTIYVGSLDNIFYAINSNGTKKWEFSTGDWIGSSPAIGIDGTIYVGSRDNKLYAVNPNGTKKWEFSTGSIIEASPAIGIDGTIYVGSWDKKLFAISPNGRKKWEFLTGDFIETSPAIGNDGTIYVSSADGNLYAIDTLGFKKWAFLTPGVIYSSPAIGTDGTIYVGSGDNKLYAINPDGTKKWEFSAESVIRSSPAIGSDGTIYVGSWNSKFYAVNPDGKKKWEFLTKNYIMSSPSIASDGTIYLGSADNNLYAVYSDCGGLASSPWPKYRKNNLNDACAASVIYAKNNFYALYSNTMTSLSFESAFNKALDKDITITQIKFDNEDFHADLSLPYTVDADEMTFNLPVTITKTNSGLYASGYSITYSFGERTEIYSNIIETAVIAKDNSELSVVGKRALDSYNASLESNPIAVINNRGVIYRLLGLYKKAREQFNAAVSLALEEFYGFTGIKMNQGVVMSDLGDDSDALDYYTGTLEDLTGEEESSVIAPQIYYNQAWEYYKSGTFSESKTKALQTINHQKTNDFLKAKAYVLLGLNDAALEDTISAMAHLQNAIDIDPASCIADIAQENICILNKALYERISICQGENYNEWTLSGQYMQKVESVDGPDSFVITVLTVNPKYDLMNNVMICEGESYNGWTTPGEYVQNLVSSCGCDSTITTKLTVNLTYEIVNDTSICNGESYNGWTTSGEYLQNLVSSCGCDSTVTTLLTVMDCATDMEQIQGNSFTIYPNPGNGEFRLLFGEKVSGAMVIKVYNSVGLPIYFKECNIANNNYSLELHHLPKGLYFIGIQTGQRLAIRKLIII